MLYVFQVDTGMMMTFEMRLAMETVMNLKRAIAFKTSIPEDKQVLLISGGESLSDRQRVCSYRTAGTDSSPIYLFAKINIESSQPPLPSVDYGDDTDMTEMIESCMSMQPSLDTLVARTELAADLNEQATKQYETCERLVDDQHSQQQGWFAVTANLEDLSRALKNKTDMLMAAFSEFTKCKSNHKEMLNKFGDDIKHLDNIPILPALLENNKVVQPLTVSTSNEPQTNPEASPAAKQLTSTTSKSTSSSSSTKRSCEVRDANNKTTTETPGTQMLKQTQQASHTSNASVTTSSGTNSSTSFKSSSSSSSLHVGEKGPKSSSTNIAARTTPKSSQMNRHSTDKSNKDQNVASDEPSDKCLSDKVDAQDPPTTTGAQNPGSTGSGTFADEPLITLRQWIDFHDSHNSLESLIELCWRGLERFTEANAEHLKLEVQELIKSTNNTSMRDIKGLSDRLFGLEKLKHDAKKVVEEQSQLAASFRNNRERFSKIKDSTLLPDLSASHKEQLQMMLANHKKMSDYINRCIKAKQELSFNLHARLKWIMYIEQQISDLDGKLMIYKENLLRLNRHLEVVNQVQRSPDLYLAAVVETLRRRRFSRRYLRWANSIAKISQEIHDEEMISRRAFDAKLSNHFLSGMFSGLTRSYPPPFATVQPDPFDTRLARITATDVQYLQTNLCAELAAKLSLPEDVRMPHVSSSSSSPSSYN